MLFQKRSMAIYAIAAFTFFSSSCSKKDDFPSPTAAFTYKASYNNNTRAPATIIFTNTSVDGGDYLWNFGDGSTSTDRSPSHKYATAGVFTVSLKASMGSKSNTTTQTVNILPAYTKAKVTKITLVSTTQPVPFSGYFKIMNGSTQVFISNGLSITGPGTFTPPTPPTLTGFSNIYSIELWKNNGSFTSDVRLAVTGLQLSLYAGGSIAANSYPTSIQGSNGLAYELQWE